MLRPLLPRTERDPRARSSGHRASTGWRSRRERRVAREVDYVGLAAPLAGKLAAAIGRSWRPQREGRRLASGSLRVRFPACFLAAAGAADAPRSGRCASEGERWLSAVARRSGVGPLAARRTARVPPARCRAGRKRVSPAVGFRSPGRPGSARCRCAGSLPHGAPRQPSSPSGVYDPRRPGRWWSRSTPRLLRRRGRHATRCLARPTSLARRAAERCHGATAEADPRRAGVRLAMWDDSTRVESPWRPTRVRAEGSSGAREVRITTLPATRPCGPTFAPSPSPLDGDVEADVCVVGSASRGSPPCARCSPPAARSSASRGRV